MSQFISDVAPGPVATSNLRFPNAYPVRPLIKWRDMKRSTALRLGACCTLASGPLLLWVWDVTGRAVNGMQVFGAMAMLTAAGLGLLLAADAIRRNRWDFPAGRCGRCGYDLTGNASGVCPECGTRVAR